MLDDWFGIGKMLEALERGTREFREVYKAHHLPVATARGEMKAAEIKARGQIRVLAIMNEADRLLVEAEVEERTLNEKLVLPLLEYGARETQGDLMEIWAKLLASSVADGQLHVSFPHILNELSANEVKILTRLYNWERDSGFDQEPNAAMLKSVSKIESEEFAIAVDNLMRTRLCTFKFRGDKEPFWPDDRTRVRDEHYLSLTTLGIRFVKACQGPLRTDN
jgi:hypothetical protein